MIVLVLTDVVRKGAVRMVHLHVMTPIVVVRKAEDQMVVRAVRMAHPRAVTSNDVARRVGVQLGRRRDTMLTVVVRKVAAIEVQADLRT